MAKRRKRSFPGEPSPAPRASVRTARTAQTVYADDQTPGIFGFFKSLAVRETIESIVIAVALAMMFKAFEAEAFIIPTGSMANALQGQHKDMACSQCGYEHQVGASHDVKVAATTCPLCRYTSPTKRNNPNHKTFNGDRILVNKFVYDFEDPQRYDVIVFKNPNHAKQNYIKRLIGLPGENILIENGDIYTMEKQPDETWSKTIQPKPARKLMEVAERFADTNYFGSGLRQVGWPRCWKQRSGEANWVGEGYGENLQYKATARPEVSWLRFSNNRPDEVEWEQVDDILKEEGQIKELNIKGRLVCDYVAHNDGVVGSSDIQSVGYHWVGDLGFEADMKIVSGNGNLSFDIVEGGAHFLCNVDVKTGTATLSVRPPEGSEINFVDPNGQVVAAPSGETSVNSSGRYQVRFFNADDRVYFWINDDLIEFDAVDYRRSDIPVPHYSLEDPADAEPLGIGCQNLEVVVDRISCFRDLYYSSTDRPDYIDSLLERFHRFGQQKYRRNSQRKGVRVSTMENESSADPSLVYQMMRSPEKWNTEEANALFSRKKGQTNPMFFLEQYDDRAKDQFLPMGDNSAQSLDGRVWNGPKFVERDMLIGRALIVFWPHSLNEPIPFFPNFKRMKFIR